MKPEPILRASTGSVVQRFPAAGALAGALAGACVEGDDAGCAEDAELKHHVETGQMDPLDQWGMDDLKMLRKNHRQPRKWRFTYGFMILKC